MECDKISSKEMILAIFIVLFVFLAAFLLGGCATKEVPVVKIQKQEVLVPIKCEIKKPQKPIFSDNVISNVADLAEYAKKLEIALNKCAK